MTISNVVSKEWRQNASLKRISRADCPRPPARGMMSLIRRILAFRAGDELLRSLSAIAAALRPVQEMGEVARPISSVCGREHLCRDCATTSKFIEECRNC